MGKPVGSLTSAALYGRTILSNIAHKALKSRVRTREEVMRDYDQGEWSNLLRDAPWNKVSSLAEYNRKAWRESELTAMVDGRLHKIHSRDYYDIKINKLLSIMKEYAGEEEELVELGSGSGTNLLMLSEAGHWRKLTGYELSSTGQEVTRELRERFGLDNIEVGYIDLLDSSSEGYRHLEGKTVFTYYCLEQLPDYTEVVFRKLIDAGIKRAINIEPTWELMKMTSLRDLATITYVWRQDYQRTIVRTARKLAAEGAINIVEAKRLHFVSNYRNDPTLVVWEPTAR